MSGAVKNSRKVRRAVALGLDKCKLSGVAGTKVRLFEVEELDMRSN